MLKPIIVVEVLFVFGTYAASSNVKHYGDVGVFVWCNLQSPSNANTTCNIQQESDIWICFVNWAFKLVFPLYSIFREPASRSQREKKNVFISVPYLLNDIHIFFFCTIVQTQSALIILRANSQARVNKVQMRRFSRRHCSNSDGDN